MTQRESGNSLLSTSLKRGFILLLFSAGLIALFVFMSGDLRENDHFGYYVAGITLLLVYVLMHYIQNNRLIGVLLVLAGTIGFWLGVSGHLRSGAIYLGIGIGIYGAASVVKPDLIDPYF